jgi:ubiquinone/menaquinone biosynthesis C-methylase UbiE
MEDINKTTFFYRKKFTSKEAKFNHPMPLPAYFKYLIGEKKSVKIAELGAGPINTIGNYFDGVEVEIIASDLFQPEYEKFWKQHNKTPIVPIEYQDMENLTYPDETFDIVHCVNALDHTPDVYKAIDEMKRVCKTGGYIYLRHAPGQKKRYGGIHYWNFEDVELPGFSKHLEGDLIVNIWKKI